MSSSSGIGLKVIRSDAVAKAAGLRGPFEIEEDLRRQAAGEAPRGTNESVTVDLGDLLKGRNIFEEVDAEWKRLKAELAHAQALRDTAVFDAQRLKEAMAHAIEMLAELEGRYDISEYLREQMEMP